MKLSQMGIGAVKFENLNKEFQARDILMQTGQMVQYDDGIMGYNNIPLRVKKSIEGIIEGIFNKCGGVEIKVPVLQSNSLLKEAVIKLAKNNIKSYKDMPVIYYQMGEKGVNEEEKWCLLNNKTTDILEAYSFDLDDENSVHSYESMKSACTAIIKILGLKAVPVICDNDTSNIYKSEELMVLSEAGESRIFYDKDSGRFIDSKLFNKPNYAEYFKKEYGINDVSILEEKKAIKVGHLYQIGNKDADNMEATYRNKEDKKVPFSIGCYGLDVTKLIMLIYEQSVVCDKESNSVGFSLPIKIAPFIAQIVSNSKNEERIARATQLYSIMNERKIPVILDDRANIQLENKKQDCKILGTPYAVILDDSTPNGFVEVEKTGTNEKLVIAEDHLVEKFEEINNNRRFNNYNAIRDLF